jgi:phosphoglycolate phosphatase
MIRCVAFDFDGTLVDSNEIKRSAFFEIAKPYDPDGTDVEQILESPTAGDRYAITRAMAKRYLAEPDPADIEALAGELAAAYGERCEAKVIACDEIAGAQGALEELRERGTLLFINTATPLAAVQSILRARKLDHFFQGVYGSDAGKLENLRTIAEQSRIQAEGLVFVGDGEDDRRAAVAFGCEFIGVAVDGRGRFDSAPDTRVRDLTTLPSLVEHLDRSAS